KNIEKADKEAGERPFLLLLVQNNFGKNKMISMDKYYDSNFRNIIEAIRSKMPLLSVERHTINLYKEPRPKFEMNSIIERMKRFFYFEI
ncbi:MAG: hypothetical protein ACXAC7_17710, partial [Candidatus Hodarchaeales archaeon]